MGAFEVITVAVITSMFLGTTVVSEEIDFSSFEFDRDASRFFMLNATVVPDAQALELTPDTINQQFFMSNKSARALFRTKFRVYGRNKTASFHTSFVFNIRPEYGSGGEGLAFIITSQSHDYMPDNSYGYWLGLFNASTNGSKTSKVLAVEFDTSKSPETNDPDGNHVGINVNGINSINLKSLDEKQINLKGHYDLQAWIQYDGNTKKLHVYVGNKSDPMPSQPHVTSVIHLSDILDEKAYFGFSASTGDAIELNCVKSWNFTIERLSWPDETLTIALSVCLPVAAIVAAGGIIVLLKYRKAKAEEEGKLLDELDKIPGRLKEFEYKDLKIATNNFSPAALLGRGGFGNVYKGVLPKGKNTVAVKRMTKDSRQGKEEFISEISVINRLRHKNLVPLLGWCHKNGELIMVYEYMPNGSLDKHIFNDDAAGGFLNWERRYNIVSGVASALLYLHEECEQQVIHRDVKASNIMLDSEYKARLGDFGLARLIELDRRSFTTTAVAGTLGYIAPECFHTGRATAESDVFSFGALTLEVSCGRHPKSSTPDQQDLVGQVWKLYRENKLLEAADSRPATLGSGSINEEDIKRLLVLGLACSHPNPEVRPSMREVTQILARTMLPPLVPSFRPSFVWSHDNSLGSSFTTSSLTSSGSVPASVNT